MNTTNKIQPDYDTYIFILGCLIVIGLIIYQIIRYGIH